MKRPYSQVLGTICILALFATAKAQNSTDSGVVDGKPPSAAQIADQAWSQLQDGISAKSGETRVATLSALSLLGGTPKAETMVRDAMHDANLDVRLAALVAAGQMERDHPHGVFHADLEKFLDSDDPKLSFTAAATLWTLHDDSGEDVLTATAEGERSSDYSFLKRSEINANRTLHSPEALAKIAVVQSLDILVPPVGMGMGAYGYLRGAPGVSPQITAIEQLAKIHTPAVEKALVVATTTKEAGARIAAAEALANFPGQPARDALYPLMSDEKSQVRLTASAAYLRNLNGPHTTQAPVKPPRRH